MIGPLRLSQRLGYAGGDLGFNLFFQTASLFLLFYYTEVMGLSPATGGWIFAAALVWDAIADPVMGYIASRTRSRWGRYRPWLLFGTVPLGLSWMMVFVPTGFAGSALVAFALGTHILFRTLYTVVSMPYLSLSAAMTSDSGERGTLAAYRMVVATATALVAALTTLQLVAVFGGGDVQRGWLAVAVLQAVIASAILLVCFATTAEDPSVQPERTPTLREMIAMLRVNGAFWTVAAWLCFSSFASTLFGKTLPYLFKYGYGREGQIGTALALIAATAMLAVPVWSRVILRTSKRHVMVLGTCVTLTGYGLFWLADGNGAMWAALTLLGIGGGAGALGFWATIPDTVELGEFRSGVRAEGMTFGLISLVQKSALGLSVGLLGEVLTAIGYVANRPQSDAILANMKLTMAIGPIVCAAAGLILIRAYPIDARLHARLLRVLARRRPRHNGGGRR